MAIHITRRELKIKTRLFVSLVVILGTMSILYFAFCRGKGYNEIKIEAQPPETVTAEPVTEQTTAPPEADMVKEGAAVIDVGTTRVPDATRKSGFRLRGDVDFDNVAEKC